MATYATPSTEEIEEVLISARYGDTEDLTAFELNFGVEALESARDQSQNGVLHMASANGHLGSSI